MGATNCQCQLDQSIISFKASPKHSKNNSIHQIARNHQSKRLRSRVNSIISPRQVEIISNRSSSHLRSNSTSNHEIRRKKILECQIQVQLDEKLYNLSIKDEIVKIKFCIPSIDCCNVNSNNDACINVMQKQQQFELAVKFNRNTQKLSIRDNGIGLRAFKLVRQLLTLRLSDAVDIPLHALIQLQAGQFLILKQCLNNCISCTIIVKGDSQTYKNGKTSKSLPSLLFVSDMSVCAYSQEHFLLHQDQQRTITNKVNITLDKSTINIKCLNKNQIFHLMENYENVQQNFLFRGGVNLYQITTNMSDKDNQNNQFNIKSQRIAYRMRKL